MPKTYVTIILDKSGSMDDTRDTVIQGFNEQVQQMKINAKESEIYGSLVTFNGDVYENLWCVPAAEINEATREDYRPEGMTALRDAVGYTLTKLKNTVPDDPDTAHLVVIISDGVENSSKHVSQSALKEQIDSLQKTGRWTFTYMGCDEAYLQKVAKETNIPISNMAVWKNDTAENATRGLRRSKKCIDRYYSFRATGQNISSQLYSTNVGQLADFTKDEDEAGSQPIYTVGDQTKSAVVGINFNPPLYDGSNS